MMPARLRFWSSIVAAALSQSSAAAHAEVFRIRVDKLTFSPEQISAHVGDIIEWTNADFIAHTATARMGDWDVLLAPGKTGRIVIRKAGTIDYFCRFHPNMIGRISVTQK
ncbi:cupredoxin domain-containing protein [Microvirga sp. 2MCAF38]|uniref:cupredoxin domain-containing protein n=1 Tax=Microvirga sp. 2MCAF38 TaxID=3232989 RepID=UPI003F9742BF